MTHASARGPLQLMTLQRGNLLRGTLQRGSATDAVDKDMVFTPSPYLRFWWNLCPITPGPGADMVWIEST